MNAANEMVYYTVAGRSTVDLVGTDGRGVWTKQTENALLQRYPDLAKGTEAEAQQAIEEQFRKGPLEISGDDFHEALGMMPPVHHAWIGNTESFQCLESSYGNVAAMWVRIGERHFRLADRRSARHDDLVRQVRERFPELC